MVDSTKSSTQSQALKDRNLISAIDRTVRPRLSSLNHYPNYSQHYGKRIACLQMQQYKNTAPLKTVFSSKITE